MLRRCQQNAVIIRGFKINHGSLPAAGDCLEEGHFELGEGKMLNNHCLFLTDSDRRNFEIIRKRIREIGGINIY